MKKPIFRNIIDSMKSTYSGWKEIRQNVRILSKKASNNLIKFIA